VIYKFITKIMVNGMNQGAFISGRSIQESALAHEVIDSIVHFKVPSLCLKMDMFKAYDRVD
jgi:hypothetical protein